MSFPLIISHKSSVGHNTAQYEESGTFHHGPGKKDLFSLKGKYPKTVKLAPKF